MRFKCTLFFIGFIALSLEIYCIKSLFLFIPQSELVSSLVISSFLAGIATANFVFTKIGSNPFFGKSSSLFWILSAIALYSVIALQNILWIPRLIDVSEKVPQGAFVISFLLFWIYLFIPAFILGGTLPLVLQLDSQEKAITSRSAASFYFWDTAGGIAGSLLTGILFIPYLGMTATLVLVVALSLGLALFFVPAKKFLLVAATPLIVLAINSGFLFNTNPYLVGGAPSALEEILNSKIDKKLFQKPSDYGWVTVGEKEIQNLNVRIMYINARGMCHSLINKDQSEITLARMATADLAPNSRVLNIGLGCGFTASEIAASRDVGSLTLIEINPVVVEAAKTVLANDNREVLSNPKTNLRIEDGAAFLRNTRERFHSVVIDIEEVNIIHSSILFTKEYFEIAKTRLLPGGKLLVWSFPVNPDFSKVMLNTLSAVFKHVDYKYLGEAIVYVASETPPRSPLERNLPDKSWATELSKIENSEVNLLANPKLSKYYDYKKNFQLPDSYFEESIQR